MPAKPADHKPADTKPVVFDLDALEREDSPEPFEFHAGGEKFTVTDIQERDWREIAEMKDTPMEWMRVYLGSDFDRFSKLTMPMWKLEKLVTSINRHFGIPQPGEGNASSGY